MAVKPPERVVIPFRGELTIKEAPGLRDSLLTAIWAGAELVVVDMSAVTFVDQTAMGVVIGARQRLVAGGGDLRLVGLQKRVARVLGLLNLSAHLPTYPTVSAALEDPLRP